MMKNFYLNIGTVMAAIVTIVGCGSDSDFQTASVVEDQVIDSQVKTKESLDVSEGFSWDMASGETIMVMLNDHPYSDAIIAKIPEFEKATGIHVYYTEQQEIQYFGKLSSSLYAEGGEPDVFMTGAYQAWEYGYKGYIEDLNRYLNDDMLTSPDYGYDDFYDLAVDSLKWDMMPGHTIGYGKQLGLPLGFEVNCIAYNRQVFDERGLKPPVTIDDLQALCQALDGFNGTGSYALATRGADNWGTIHPGYMSTYTNFGAKDFDIIDGRLVSQLNSPESVMMNEKWVEIMRTGSSTEWSEASWYNVTRDLGEGKAAMAFDADIIFVQMNDSNASKVSGNLAWAPMPVWNTGQPLTSNLWIWALSMNRYSTKKIASWMFIQYFTGKDYSRWSAIEMGNVDPVRESIWEDEDFLAYLSEFDGYEEMFRQTIDSASIQFTPQPYFFETTNLWAKALRKMVQDEDADVEATLEELKVQMDRTVSDLEVRTD